MVAACHCESCRKHTGAPVAVFVDYEIHHVQFSGTMLKKYVSSQDVVRSFCSNCGSTMTYEGLNTPNMLHIHLGVFDKPELFTPTENENTKTQLSYVCIQMPKNNGCFEDAPALITHQSPYLARGRMVEYVWQNHAVIPAKAGISNNMKLSCDVGIPDQVWDDNI